MHKKSSFVVIFVLAVVLLVLGSCSDTKFSVAASASDAMADAANHDAHPRKIFTLNRIIDTKEQPDLGNFATDSSLAQFHVHVKRPSSDVDYTQLLQREFAAVGAPHYLPHNTFTIVAPRDKVFQAYKKLKSQGLVEWIGEVKHEDKVEEGVFEQLMKKKKKKHSQQAFDDVDVAADAESNDQSVVQLDVLLATDNVGAVAAQWRQQIAAQTGVARSGYSIAPVAERKLRVTIPRRSDASEIAHWLASNHMALHIQYKEQFELLGGHETMSLALPMADVDPLSDAYKDFLVHTSASLGQNSEVGGANMPDVQYLWKKGLDGSGEILGIGDTGVDHGHCAFSDPKRATPFNKIDMSHRKIVGYHVFADNKDYKDGHGTHVVGSVVGEAPGSMGRFDGVARKARVFFFDVGYSDKTLRMPEDLHAQYFPIMYNVSSVTSHSWGTRKFGQYTLSSREVDLFSYEHDDFLAVYAAGNSGREGDGTIASPATSKNALTVGASQTSQQSFILAYPLYAEILKDQVKGQVCNANSALFQRKEFCASLGRSSAPCENESAALCDKIKRAKDCCSNAYLRRFCCSEALIEKVKSHPEWFSEKNMAVFSSRGPTKDRRLKPDIVAPGQPIFSARSDGTTGKDHCPVPLVLQGTSMATPIVSGYAIMTRQYFRKGFYPSGKPNPKDAITPSGALLKAMLIHSAVELDGVVDKTGTDRFEKLARAPSPIQGFGRVKLTNVLKFANESNFELFKIENKVSSGESHAVCFKVSKKAAAAGSIPAFRSTLVWMDYPASPNAAVTLVNNLDLQVINEESGEKYLGNGQLDFVNNVEQVTLKEMPSTARTLRVVVKGTNVPHGPQKYATVVTCVGCQRVSCGKPAQPAKRQKKQAAPAEKKEAKPTTPQQLLTEEAMADLLADNTKL